MKKTLIGLLAMSVLLTTSCLKESVLSQGAGDEVVVSFTTSLRETPKTKALGNDAGSVDKLEVAVYKETEGEVELVMTKTVTEFNDGAEGTKSAEVTVTLIKGQTYRVAFWAQDADYTAYEFNAETSEVSINYENVKANTASADAFFASTEVEVTGSFSKAVTLSRPFAQINFLTSASDLEAAAAVGVNPVNSSVTASGVASTFNVLTGVAEDVVTGDVTYQTQPIHKVTVEGNQVFESATIAAKDAQYYYLATAYVLVPTAEEGATEEPTVTATMTVDNCEPVNVGPLTVKRNYRTNVYGDFLTSQGVFTVQVNPGFAGSNIEKEHVEIADGVMILETEVIEETGEVVPTTFGVTNANGLKWFAERVNAVQTKAAAGTDYAYDVNSKTVKLLADINLEGTNFVTIGYNTATNTVTEWTGTFDGNGHTIKNLWRTDLTYANKRAVGLFSILKDATIQNLTLENFIAATYGGEAAALACVATGNCVFENITFRSGSVVSYNNDTAPVIGWANVGNFTLKNIIVTSDVTIFSLWDSYDTTLGGLIGTLESPSTVTIEKANVSCKLHAFNDVCANYQWYAYRRTGMIIGNMSETKTENDRTTPDPAAAGVTCTDVEVNYGTWMNYHYCEFEANGKPSYASEGQWKFSRVEGQEWGRESKIDVANCEHDTDEDHNICLPVDQLFGGGQGVYGLATYTGVTVNYPVEYKCETCGQQHNVGVTAGGNTTTGDETTAIEE